MTKTPPAPATRTWTAAAPSTVGALHVGDLVLLDPVYGNEEIVGIDILYILYIRNGGPPVHKLAVRQHTLRAATTGTLRYVARFPHEPCFRWALDKKAG